MLFAYPVEAIAENWFHDCLVETLQTIHTSVEQKQSPPAWPQVLPKAYRAKLRRRYGLKKRLITYQTVVTTLSAHDLNRVIEALNEQNQIELLLSGGGNCESLDNLPKCIHEPVKKLFEFAFEKLKDLGIRDRQYEVIYDQIPYQVCAFCGCEYFDAPGAPRTDLDHYLAESKYPFAAVNLSNLVPMGHKCNSKYKLAQDILYKDDGTRRKSYYPYGHSTIKISLKNSKPFEGSYRLFRLPRWQIDFDPDSEEASTWDTVFHIRERYERDILDPDFMSWLREFSSWCSAARIMPTSEQKLIDTIEQYSKHLENMRMRDRAFLKAAVFRMLLHHCQQGNQRLFTLIQGVVIGGMA